jgi:hypothetical protein
MTPPEKNFNPVNHEHRGVRYEKHSKKLASGTNRFISDASCHKCGSYTRVWVSKGSTSKCVACKQEAQRKVIAKKEVKAGYVAVSIEKRRAIEAHQERAREHYNDL